MAIIALGCFHPVIKVQSASMHFFLGSDQEQDEEEDEEDVGGHFVFCRVFLIKQQGPDVKTLQHRREINKKTRSGEKKMSKQIKAIKKVRPLDFPTYRS